MQYSSAIPLQSIFTPSSLCISSIGRSVELDWRYNCISKYPMHIERYREVVRAGDRSMNGWNNNKKWKCVNPKVSDSLLNCNEIQCHAIQVPPLIGRALVVALLWSNHHLQKVYMVYALPCLADLQGVIFDLVYCNACMHCLKISYKSAECTGSFLVMFFSTHKWMQMQGKGAKERGF